MGCCVSKKCEESPGSVGKAARRRSEARDPPPPPPEEETVKEVLSETPKAKPRPRPRRVAAAAGQEALEAVAKAKVGGARVKDGSGARARRAVGPTRSGPSGDEKSEVASESSAATTAAGPEWSPAKAAPRKRAAAVPGEATRVARRDRGGASPVPGAGRASGGGGRASPSPPPPPRRRDTGERPGRRSPSPAAKRTQEQRRAGAGAAAAATPGTQRKPPVPARPCGRASPRRGQEAAAPPRLSAPVQLPDVPASSASPQPAPLAEEENAAATGGGGEGKESLDNPLVAMECFIFL
ncbi:translation initiation factor IF-2-like [Panicum virgatum]|uniref:Serine/arginine repetitive matrix protein 1-like n=1 Tax=Panicum virgatum TaxID=38727 RepID=A0A8T0UD02_PANVG|nr:translation initiation factor IF-2-like [Panicum virgatum]KAG2618309.1 hypothetical protein PVAP13_3NG080015 [Panicum virgatum]